MMILALICAAVAAGAFLYHMAPRPGNIPEPGEDDEEFWRFER